MQIINSNNDYNVSHQRIIRVKYQGLYKEYPKYAEGLLSKLKENPAFLDFEKDRNLKIIISAIKSGYSAVESSIKIYYEKPVLSKLKKIWRAIFSSPKKIELSMRHDGISEKMGLDVATEKLKSVFVPREKIHDAHYDDVWSGHLDWRIKKIRDKDID